MLLGALVMYKKCVNVSVSVRDLALITSMRHRLETTTRCKKKPCTFSFVNNLQVTESTKTKFTDNVTDIYRFVYAKFGWLKTRGHCVTWDFLKMNPQEYPLSCRALYTAYASRNQDVHHRADSFHRRYVLPVTEISSLPKLHRKNVTTMKNVLICD